MMDEDKLISSLPRQFIYGFLQKYFVKVSMDKEFYKELCAYANSRDDFGKMIKESYKAEYLDKENTVLNIKYLFENWNKINWKNVKSPLTDLIYEGKGGDTNGL